MSYRRVPYSVKRYVRSVLDAEVEDKQATWSLATAFASIGNTWTELSLAQPAEGVTGATRVGKKIRIKSLEVNGVCAGGASELATDDAYNIVRIVICTTDWSAGGTPLATATIGLNEVLNKNRTQLLSKKYLDKYIPFEVSSTEQGGGDGYAPSLRKFKYYKRWKNGMPINFADDTASAPDKLLILGMLSDSAAVPNPGFVCGWVKVRWEDA